MEAATETSTVKRFTYPLVALIAGGSFGAVVGAWNSVAQKCIAIEGNGRIFDSDFVNPIPCRVETWFLKGITYVLQSMTPG